MSFSGDLKKFRLKIEGQDDEIVRGVELALFSAVIDDTPVDMGRLKGNWMGSFGSPAQGTLETDDPNGSATKDKMMSLVTGGPKGGRLTYLANNLPYAMAIEYGHSTKKAPQGMVRKNVARFQTLVDEEVKKGRL